MSTEGPLASCGAGADAPAASAAASRKVLIKKIKDLLDDALPGAAVAERVADRTAPALREEAARVAQYPGLIRAGQHRQARAQHLGTLGDLAQDHDGHAQ